MSRPGVSDPALNFANPLVLSPSYRLRSCIATPLALKALFPSSSTSPNQSIIQSTLGSWFLVFGAWVLGPIVFLIHRARIWGCARGGSRATFLGPLAFIRPNNFVLKSLLFLIPFLFDFGSILGAKMTPKIHKNPQKVVFEIAPHFESIFEPIFIDFSFDFRPPAKVKTRLKP